MMVAVAGAKMKRVVKAIASIIRQDLDVREK